MAADSTNRNPGPRSLAALLPPLTRPAFRKRSPASARIMSDWLAIAGPDLAARTAPKKLTAGVLTLACDGPTALELQHLAVKLAERINVALGEAIVRQVRFVQQTIAASPPKASAPPPRVDLPKGDLTAALERLGATIATRERDL